MRTSLMSLICLMAVMGCGKRFMSNVTSIELNAEGLPEGAQLQIFILQSETPPTDAEWEKAQKIQLTKDSAKNDRVFKRDSSTYYFKGLMLYETADVYHTKADDVRCKPKPLAMDAAEKSLELSLCAASAEAVEEMKASIALGVKARASADPAIAKEADALKRDLQVSIKTVTLEEGEVIKNKAEVAALQAAKTPAQTKAEDRAIASVDSVQKAFNEGYRLSKAGRTSTHVQP